MQRSYNTRPATVGDREAVLALVRAAFGSGDRDGRAEVDIVVGTWARGGSVKPIDLVAVDNGEVVGHVLAASGSTGSSQILAVAPLAVAPSRQGQGIGSALIRDLLRRAEDAGWPAVVLLGDPNYYGRFGFESSGPLGITYPPSGKGNPHFQIRLLSSYGRLDPGDFRYCWEDQVVTSGDQVLRDDGYRFVVPLDLPEDMFDGQGHLNNAAVDQIFNDLRVRYMITEHPELGGDLGRRGFVVAVRELHLLFESQGMPGERFVGGSRIGGRRGRAQIAEQRIVEESTGRSVARAWLVLLILRDGRVAEWPDGYWETVAALEGRAMPERPRIPDMPFAPPGDSAAT